MVRLRWIASSGASALHAAAALADGRKIVDARLADALAGPAAKLTLALQETTLPPGLFFQHAIAWACRVDDPEQLAENALSGAAGRADISAQRTQVAAALARIFAAQERAFPQMARQLQVRGAPLAEQWEARGPGLLAALGRMTQRDALVEACDVALVYPALGGGGAASLPYNLVRVEAVLANPHGQLPEVARLGWLIAQLGFDSAKFASAIPPDRLERLAGLVLAPAAIAAAEHVELARSDLATLQLALNAWGLADDRRPELAEMLSSWWQAWRAAPGEWRAAVQQFDTMMANGTGG